MTTTLGTKIGTTLGTWIDSTNWQAWPLVAGPAPTEGNVISGPGNNVIYGAGNQVVV